MLLPITCSILLLSITIGKATTSSDLFLLPSGRHVSLKEVHRHHSTVSASHLPHILFEFNGNDLICSHHACLNIRELAPEDHIIVKKNNFGIGHSPVDIDQPTRSTKVRYGRDFTFAIDPWSKNLITAWGPALNLHPLNTLKHPGVFVNAAVLDSPCLTHTNGTVFDRLKVAISRTFLKSYETHGKLDNLESQSFGINLLHFTGRQNQCTRELTLQLGIEIDTSFCALYDNDPDKVQNLLDTLENEISRLFFNTACVRVTFFMSSRSCRTRTGRGFYKMPTPRQPLCREPGSCRFSQTVLQYISKYVIGSFPFEPDGTFLFTGFGDNSSLGGAAYPASACNMESSCAWIVRSHPIVIAHEIGHMLGAGHDLEGIMKEVVNPDEPLVLSTRSQAEIRKFVELDSRSWCLQRQSLFSDSVTAYQRVHNGAEIRGPLDGLISVTFASLISENQSDLIILFREPNRSKTTLSYVVKNAIACSQTARSNDPFRSEKINLKQKRSLQLTFPNQAHALGIAFGHFSDSASRDFLLSFSVLANGTALPYYKVGHGMGRDGSPPKLWTHDIRVHNLYAESVQCSSLSVGHVLNSSSIDLVYAIVDRRNHRNVLKYTIGFDIGPKGIPRGGWTREIDIPGWYGRNTSALGISILDVDNDGKPELLVYHVAEWRYRKVPFLRVGRGLDKGGHVTGGWTKFVQGTDLHNAERYLLVNGMAHRAEGSSKLVQATAMGSPNGEEYLLANGVAATKCRGAVVLASISEKILSEPPDISYRLSEDIVTSKLLETSEDLAPFDYFQDGCLECYTASYVQNCVNDLRACSSHVHEVHLASTETSVTVQPLRMRIPAVQRLRFGTLKPIKNSIYCTGFHHLRTYDGGCEITDTKTVLAKGVELSFLEVLSEINPKALQNIKSTSLYEVPVGVGGPSRNPTVVEITIDGKHLSRKMVIDEAIRRLQSRAGFALFTWKEVTKKNNKWYVRYVFKRKLFQT